MPKKLERKLRREAKLKFPGDKEKQDQYVYGTLQNLGLLKKKGDDKK